MRRRRRRINTESVGASGSQLLGLSLFVMLLAFFIVLNAISSYKEDKVAPVLKSLESSFASKISQRGDDNSSVTASEDALDEGSAIERMQALFVSQIPAHRAKIDKSSGTMHVQLGLDDFERAVTGLGAPEEKEKKGKEDLNDFFLPALVALIKNDAAGLPYRMDMVVNVAQDPAVMQNRSPDDMRHLSQRIALIAQHLEGAGLPVRLIGVGIKQGEADTVDIFFSPHIPYNPLGRDNEKH